LPDSLQIYQNDAQRYHTLISREDYEGNLLPAILKIDPLTDQDVIELGAGTGRLSCLIAPRVKSLLISDLSLPMLSIAIEKLVQMKLNNWHACLEAHHALPFTPCCADIVIAGWSFCYAAIHAKEDWERMLADALHQVDRILRPKGKLILIESLGTGFERPQAPAILQDYLGYLNENGFNSTWIRTDYCFKDLTEAQQLTRFFFGDDPMPMWQTDAGVIVPECTGIWWKGKL
jgi:SAM-dependent methyltransferase